jgi:hypothetical protein
MRILTSTLLLTAWCLSGCVNGIPPPDGWEPPPPPKPCEIPVIVDREKRGCIARKEW